MKLKYCILTTGISLSFLVGSQAYAQKKPEKKPAEKAQVTAPADAKQQDPAKGTLAEEIEVVRPYKPVLADVSKIRRSPDLNTDKTFKPALKYSVSDIRLEQNTEIKQLQSNPLTENIQPELKNNYVKVGAGNLNTGLGELYINTGKDEALQAGLLFKHFNQKGSLPGQQVSRQQVGIFGRSIQDKFALDGDIGYNRYATNFYGFDPDIQPAENPDIDKQTYNLVTLNGGITRNFTGNNEGLDYKANVKAYFLKNKTDQQETSFQLNGLLNKSIQQFNFGLKADLDFTNVKQPLLNTSNNIARLNPYVKLQGDNYMLRVGLNFVSEFGKNSRTNLLPDVTAEFSIAPQYATLFGGFTGDVLKTSLKDLANENPYISSDIEITNAVEKSNIFGGIKGNAGPGFGYKAMASYRNIDNLPLFLNSYPVQNRFDVIYDEGKSKVFSLEGEISVQASDALLWTGRFITTDYNLAQQKEAWFKPAIQLASNIKGTINKSFTIDGEIVLNGGSKALVQSPEEKIISLDSYIDLSGGAEYKIKNGIGIYLRVNNILSNNYQRYLYYPRVGINFLGGFNYSF